MLDSQIVDSPHDVCFSPCGLRIRGIRICLFIPLGQSVLLLAFGFYRFFHFYGFFVFYWFLVSMNSVGFVASIGFLVFVGFWFLLPFLAFWFLLTVGFGFYWLCACVGHSTYGRVTRNYRELLALGLRWLKVIFVSFFLLLLLLLLLLLY